MKPEAIYGTWGRVFNSCLSVDDGPKLPFTVMHNHRMRVGVRSAHRTPMARRLRVLLRLRYGRR